MKPTLAAAVAAISLAAAIPPQASAASAADAADYAPGEVIVRFDGGPERVLHLPTGIGVGEASAALDSNPRVAYAAPNYVAHAAARSQVTPVPFDPGYVPNDPGSNGTAAGGWQTVQWNFLPCGSLCAPGTTALPFESRGGIGMPMAWARMRQLGRAGGAGVKVAVLDTGVAYKNVKPKVAKSPDFQAKQFARGIDTVDDDYRPTDGDGHGTHVAGTIAEQTDNGRAVTGIAYGAKIMPVRVLDNSGEGKARDIGAGIIWAAKHGAKVINMSFEFGLGVKKCSDIPTMCRAVRIAGRKGAVVVAAAGNDYGTPATFPARISGVIGVGGSTEGGCIGNYSNVGSGIDIVAPGGQGEGQTLCRTADRPIFQLTYSTRDLLTFGYPTDYAGTSMSAAHVSGVAALVIASGELGAHPSPSRVLCQLSATARKSNLGEAYDPARWGAGLLDAYAAVSGARC